MIFYSKHTNKVKYKVDLKCSLIKNIYFSPTNFLDTFQRNKIDEIIMDIDTATQKFIKAFIYGLTLPLNVRSIKYIIG